MSKVSIQGWRKADWLIGVLGALVLGGSACGEGLVSKRHGAAGVALQLFGPDRSRPAARVNIAQLTLGAQRRGFFQIGVLPLAVAESVVIRFQRPEPAALRDLPRSFEALAGTDTLCLRPLAIHLDDGAAPALTAESVEIAGDEPWKLRTIVLADGTRIAAARLETTGRHAGRLTREDGVEPRRIALFSDTKPQ